MALGSTQPLTENSTRCRMLSFAWFSDVWNLYTDVSEHFVCSIFIDRYAPTCLWRWNREDVPKRRNIRFRRRGNHPKESVQHSGHGESLKSRVPGVFPGGKGGRCVRLITLPPSCAVFMKSGNLNFLEPSGPLQTCNGTALPLPFTHRKRIFFLFVCLCEK